MGSYSQPFDVIRADIANLDSTSYVIECTYANVSLAHSGSGSVYGAYGQLHAAPGYAVRLIGVFLHPTGGAAADHSYAVEVASGEAGAEVPLVTLPFWGAADGSDGPLYYPLNKPVVVANARLAARFKNSTTAGNVRVSAVWERVS